MRFDNPSLAAAEAAIPSDLIYQSGKVFYSGRKAFSVAAPLYVIGLNPGGDPTAQAEETIGSHTAWVQNVAPEDWSAYRDEAWKGKPPGCHGMQPRLLHVFKSLGLNPGSVPASNLVFVRSRRERDISNFFKSLADRCWPFHKYVIEILQPKVVLCLGKTAGYYVCARTGANERYATFIEANNRRWQSHAFRAPGGLRVVVATHPGIADWTTPECDPTGLLVTALKGA